MSLLLLKTRDLTWQDHTLNTEVMLAPTRSGLLLNKHKTLGAKCEMDKQLYERQRTQCLKDFLTARRMIDRQRQRLVQRQRDLDTKRVRTFSAGGPFHSEAPQPLAEALKERSASAPSGARAQKGLPVIVVPSGNVSPDPSERSSGIFVTELAEPFPQHRQSRTSIKTTISAPAEVLRKDSTPSSRRPPVNSRRKPPTRSDLKSGDQQPSHDQDKKTSLDKKVEASPQQPPFRRTISVRFPDTLHSEDDDSASRGSPDTHKGPSEPTLEEKIRVFIADIDNFAARSHEEREASREAWLTLTKRKRKSDLKVPLVARRYNTWQVDHDQLLQAFDAFCQHQTMENLTRAMRLTAKMKASVNVTKNQSIVPSIAAFKSTRAFKSLLNRQAEQTV